MSRQIICSWVLEFDNNLQALELHWKLECLSSRPRRRRREGVGEEKRKWDKKKRLERKTHQGGDYMERDLSWTRSGKISEKSGFFFRVDRECFDNICFRALRHGQLGHGHLVNGHFVNGHFGHGQVWIDEIIIRVFPPTLLACVRSKKSEQM